MILKSNHNDTELKVRIAENRQYLTDRQKFEIRFGFDQALTSLEAESWIAIAFDKGYKEMAVEMMQDLQTELS